MADKSRVGIATLKFGRHLEKLEQQIGIGIWSHDGTVWFILENFMYNPDEPCFRKATWRFETVELGVFGEICAEFSQL